MRYSKKMIFAFAVLTTAMLFVSCTKKTLITGEDGYKYYKVTRNHRIGVKDLDGNVIVPIKMKDISYSCRFNKQNEKERWFWCCCYDNDYKEIYNAKTSQCIIGENLKFKGISFTYLDGHYKVEPTSTYFLVKHEKEGNKGFYNHLGKEIIPLKYQSIIVLSNSGMMDFPDKYEKADLIRCSNGNVESVFDAEGRCVVSADFQYKSIRKVDKPTPEPLLECKTRDGRYDYRYSQSGEVFMSGLKSGLGVHVINKGKELYYLSSKDANGVRCYYDIYGKLILKEPTKINLFYDDERGFYYWNPDTDKDRYINKKINDNGHVVPVRAYSNSSWGWDDYGHQDIWMEYGGEEYEWQDYPSPTNSYNGSSSKTKDCPICYGSGDCQNCNGKGWRYVLGDPHDCTNCNKTGHCPYCNGTGKVPAY